MFNMKIIEEFHFLHKGKMIKFQNKVHIQLFYSIKEYLGKVNVSFFKYLLS